MAKALYEFAIKKDVLSSGEIIFTPVCRRKGWNGIFGLYLFNHPWERITKIYNEYTIMDLHFTPKLSFAECEEHIAGYQKSLENANSDQVMTVEFQELEERKI